MDFSGLNMDMTMHKKVLLVIVTVCEGKDVYQPAVSKNQNQKNQSNTETPFEMLDINKLTFFVFCFDRNTTQMNVM